MYYAHHTGIAVGSENCNTESPPLRDPTLWTFMIDATAIQDLDRNMGMCKVKDLEKHANIITVTVVSTVLAFIFGVTCGLLMYCCFWAIIIKKAEQRKTSDKKMYPEEATHTVKEASAIYDEVTHHICEPGIPNAQMELDENIAYEQIYNCMLLD